MSNFHGRGRAQEDTESAIRWIDEELAARAADQRPSERSRPGVAFIPNLTPSTEQDLFTREFVVEAYLAGRAQSWLIRVLGGATGLLAEAATLFRAYEAHHRSNVLQWTKKGESRQAETSREKEKRNADIAGRIEAFLIEPETPRDLVRLSATALVADLFNLMAESRGVAGLHQNGDEAPWEELTAGGRFEQWLGSYDRLRDLLVAPADLFKGVIHFVEPEKAEGWYTVRGVEETTIDLVRPAGVPDFTDPGDPKWDAGQVTANEGNLAEFFRDVAAGEATVEVKNSDVSGAILEDLVERQQADEFRLETAACLWEEIISLHMRGSLKDPDGTLQTCVNPDAPPVARAVTEWLEGSGYGEVRLTVLGWVDECDAAWKAEDRDDYSGSFDWDFVPAWLDGYLRRFLELPPTDPASGGPVPEVPGEGYRIGDNPCEVRARVDAYLSTHDRGAEAGGGNLLHGGAARVITELVPCRPLRPTGTMQLSNLREVTSGPLADASVLDGLMDIVAPADGPAPAAPHETVSALAFSLITGDPRFDPARPVKVNGFLYVPADRPTKED
jgi:hypothetical protein